MPDLIDEVATQEGDAQTIQRLAREALHLRAPSDWEAALRLATHVEPGAVAVAMRAHRRLLELEIAWEEESGSPDLQTAAVIGALYDFILREGRFQAYCRGEWCRSFEDRRALRDAIAQADEEASRYA